MKQLSLFDAIPSNDPRPLPVLVSEQYQFPLQYHEIDGVNYYAVQDWIAGVGLSANPRDFWNKLKKRLAKSEIELSTPCLHFAAIRGSIIP